MSDLPPIRVYMDPILETLRQRGGQATNDELNDAVAQRLNLSSEQLAAPHGRGDKRSEFQYRMAWARTKLKKAGRIDSAGRGRWQLVEIDGSANT